MAAPVDDPLKSNSRSDQELIAAINDGDSDAFEALYYRYRDWVVSLAYRFTGDRELALDVLQETFLYFVKKFPGFRLTAHLKTFLYPAVRNLSIAARRKAKRFNQTRTKQERSRQQPRRFQSGARTNRWLRRSRCSPTSIAKCCCFGSWTA